jgi:hypothetical protein
MKNTTMPLVAPISKSAGREICGSFGLADGLWIGKSAIRQIWKCALPTAALLLVLLLAAPGACAVDFHCVTAQDLQNALTLAANNGADDNLYLTNGYYIGNFNFNSSEARNLTVLPEPGLTNTGITIDGAGGGRALNLSSSAITGNITVQGITFVRNCGNPGIGALRPERSRSRFHFATRAECREMFPPAQFTPPERLTKPKLPLRWQNMFTRLHNNNSYFFIDGFSSPDVKSIIIKSKEAL